MKGMTTDFHHITVLLHETVDMLDIKPDGIYVDATLGGQGTVSTYFLSLDRLVIFTRLTKTRRLLIMHKFV